MVYAALLSQAVTHWPWDGCRCWPFSARVLGVQLTSACSCCCMPSGRATLSCSTSSAPFSSSRSSLSSDITDSSTGKPMELIAYWACRQLQAEESSKGHRHNPWRAFSCIVLRWSGGDVFACQGCECCWERCCCGVKGKLPTRGLSGSKLLSCDMASRLSPACLASATCCNRRSTSESSSSASAPVDVGDNSSCGLEATQEDPI